MFYKYIIASVNNEEVLYLYMSNSYEIAKDFNSSNTTDEDIKKRVTNYINNRGISFKGNKVYLVVDDIIIASLSLNNSKYNPIIKEYLPDYKKIQFSNNKNIDDTYNIKLQQPDKTIKTLPLKHYLLGTLATMISPYFNIEAIKAQAIISRTYCLKKMQEEGFVKAVNPIQLYRDINYYKLLWGKNYSSNIGKLTTAINETAGKFLSYQGQIIEPDYHIISNGKTESKEFDNKPYLNTVNSIWDLKDPSYLKTTIMTFQEMARLLNINPDDINDIEILNITKGNRIKKIRIGNNIFSGQNIMTLLKLPSNDISFVISKPYIKLITRGIGNGYGMSQHGANAMANSGYNYSHILAHYFPNTKLYRAVDNKQ